MKPETEQGAAGKAQEFYDPKKHGHTEGGYYCHREKYRTRCGELTKQLAAIAAAQQPLVDALSKLSEQCTPRPPRHEWTGLIFCSAVKQICDDALAKVKEGQA